MIPLLVFLLGCLGIYLGTIEAAFSALMRLSLRLIAERSDRPSTLGAYLDDPILLFAPVRLLLGLVAVGETVLFAMAIGVDALPKQTLVAASSGAFVLVFEILLPMLVVGRDAERVLALLLPSFNPIALAIGPLMAWTMRSLSVGRRPPAVTAAPEEVAEDTGGVPPFVDPAAQQGI